ncbi:MAG: DoxX family protein [Terriglobales bacterium]|jgi:putative oxidoreductase
MSKKQDIALLFARVVLGFILLAHAGAALHGSNSKPYSGVEALGLPHWTAHIAIWVELGCGLLLFVGKFTRVAAALATIHMVLGIKAHWQEGFLYSADFPLGLAALSLVFLAIGGGRFSLDSLSSRKQG